MWEQKQGNVYLCTLARRLMDVGAWQAELNTAIRALEARIEQLREERDRARAERDAVLAECDHALQAARGE